MTVDELLSRISSRELTEWSVLYKIEAEEAQRSAMEANAARGAVAARRG